MEKVVELIKTIHDNAKVIHKKNVYIKQTILSENNIRWNVRHKEKN